MIFVLEIIIGCSLIARNRQRRCFRLNLPVVGDLAKQASNRRESRNHDARECMALERYALRLPHEIRTNSRLNVQTKLLRTELVRPDLHESKAHNDWQVGINGCETSKPRHTTGLWHRDCTGQGRTWRVSRRSTTT